MKPMGARWRTDRYETEKETHIHPARGNLRRRAGLRFALVGNSHGHARHGATEEIRGGYVRNGHRSGHHIEDTRADEGRSRRSAGEGKQEGGLCARR